MYFFVSSPSYIKQIYFLKIYETAILNAIFTKKGSKYV